MRSAKMIAIYRLLLSLLAFSALITQFVTRTQVKPFNPVNFFSYFTIESNILVAVILLLSSLGTATLGRSEQFGVLRGAATVYILTTGRIYFLLLRKKYIKKPLSVCKDGGFFVLPICLLKGHL
ncbi:Pr6Pr family membrane protein [Bacillus cereus]|uniref:Pr6Pr family membrane protein n=1 Tax=Bacillus cereus TaxID=1396 RepID=UPI0039B6EE03